MEKRLLLLSVVLVVVFCGSAVFALDKMGPPTAGLEKGQFGLGVDYMYSDMDLGGNIDQPDEDENLHVHKVFGTLACGAMDNVELFLRLGIGRAEGEDVVAEDQDIEWGSSEFAWGIGGKVTLLEQDSCAWGTLIEFSQFKSEEHPSDHVVDFDELQIAIGPTYKLSDSISVYGGPFYHHVDGKATDKSPPGPPDRGKVSSSLDTDAFGGYLGAQFKINEDASVTTEFQYTDDAIGFGAGFLWRI
jgi:hypothetical protein